MCSYARFPPISSPPPASNRPMFLQNLQPAVSGPRRCTTPTQRFASAPPRGRAFHYAPCWKRAREREASVRAAGSSSERYYFLLLLTKTVDAEPDHVARLQEFRRLHAERHA